MIWIDDLDEVELRRLRNRRERGALFMKEGEASLAGALVLGLLTSLL